MNPTALRSRWLGIGMLAVLACACASGPKVRTRAAADFVPSTYRTYGFFPSQGTDRAGYATLLTQYLEAAAERELQARGYQRSEQPDLLVNFHIVARDKVQVTSTPNAYYGWRRAYAWGGMGYSNEVRSFTEGTLNVDLVDRARNQLVWEGIAVGRITEQKLQNPQPSIDGAVAAIFAQFPTKPAGAGGP
jgi:hypothetical protein